MGTGLPDEVQLYCLPAMKQKYDICRNQDLLLTGEYPHDIHCTRFWLLRRQETSDIDGS